MRWPRERSLLSAVDVTFSCMEESAAPPTLEGAELGEGLPQGPISLRELRERSLGPQAPRGLSEAVWSELAFRAQRDGDDWTVAALWMMIPGLRAAVRRVLLRGRAPYADIEADVVEGFLAELKTVDVDKGGVAARLWWAGYRRGLHALTFYRFGAGPLPHEDWMDIHVHPSPGGHPDQVLDRAVRRGVITAEEAELIGSTRIESEGLSVVARRLRQGYLECRMRRTEAEERLAAFLLIPGGASSPCDPHGRSHRAGAEEQAA